MPPPRRAKIEISEAPKASATSASTTVRSSPPTVKPPGPVRYQKKTEIASSARPATSIPVIAPARNAMVRPRSEEHTSELQSLMRNSYAVFCLKKKNKTDTKPKNKHSS